MAVRKRPAGGDFRVQAEFGGSTEPCALELVEPYLFYDYAGADLAGFAAALASHLDSR